MVKHCASRHSHCGLEMAASAFASQTSATAQQSSLVWKYSFSSTPLRNHVIPLGFVHTAVKCSDTGQVFVKPTRTLSDMYPAIE